MNSAEVRANVQTAKSLIQGIILPDSMDDLIGWRFKDITRQLTEIQLELDKRVR